MTDREADKTGVLFLRNLPRGLKTRFKAWCAKKDLSMTEVAEELMREVCGDGVVAQTITCKLAARKR